jgi:D-amino peptidase
MKILVSVDMEGCAGIVHVDQTRRGGSDFERARRWMTAEANAAALGAFDAGATDVLLNDSHADMRNLLLDELDARVRVVSGSLKPLSMVQGLTDMRPDAVFFVGYHGGAGTRAAVLDHTYYGAVVHEVCIHPHGAPLDRDGIWCDEAALNALVAGEFGTPVALVTGDRAVTSHARERFENVTTVEVKTSITRFSAESLHPLEACRRIREAARTAVQQIPRVRPYTLALPLTLTVTLQNAGYADAAEIAPGIERLDARRVRYVATSPREMLRAVLAITKLAGTVVV